MKRNVQADCHQKATGAVGQFLCIVTAFFVSAVNDRLVAGVRIQSDRADRGKSLIELQRVSEKEKHRFRTIRQNIFIAGVRMFEMGMEPLIDSVLYRIAQFFIEFSIFPQAFQSFVIRFE